MNDIFLDYLTTGKRHYKNKPVPAYQRRYWEFQAVITGSCFYDAADEGRQILSERCLWVSTPDSRHGWTAESGEPCHVIVFHFNDVPEQLKTLLGSHNRRQLTIKRKQVAQLQELHQQLWRQFTNPGKAAELYVQKGVTDLSLMLLDEGTTGKPIAPKQYHDRLINRATSLFIANLQNGWTVERIARELNLSSGHLRRIFREEYGLAPHEVFNEKRLEFAADLLVSSEHSVTDIAGYCGFSSASVFIRYFKKYFNTTPLGYRHEGA